MQLIDFISVADADMVVHIVTQDSSVYFGTVRGSYDELSACRMNDAKVNAIFSGFGGLCVEISE